LYTVKEIAPLLKVTPRTLRRFCEDGVLKNAVKLGREWRFPGNDVIALCASQGLPLDDAS
jgi:excisionase family DNA binding protein